MATIDIHNLSGEKVGTLDLAEEIFGAVNEDLLWEAVKHYRAGQRAWAAGRIHRDHQGEEAAKRASRIRGFGDGRSLEGGEASGEEGIRERRTNASAAT